MKLLVAEWILVLRAKLKIKHINYKLLHFGAILKAVIDRKDRFYVECRIDIELIWLKIILLQNILVTVFIFLLLIF